MTNKNENLRKLGKLYEQALAERKDEDFVVNKPQMSKLFEVYDFFEKVAKKDGNATANPLRLIPREEHGGVTALFTVFDMYGEMLEDFKKIVRYVSALTIDALTTGEICISVTVPNVFIPKK